MPAGWGHLESVGLGGGSRSALARWLKLQAQRKGGVERKLLPASQVLEVVYHIWEVISIGRSVWSTPLMWASIHLRAIRNPIFDKMGLVRPHGRTPSLRRKQKNAEP